MNKKITASIMSLLMIVMAMPVMAADTNPAVVTGSVVVGTCPVGTIGLNTNVGVLNFGALAPEQASDPQTVELTITPTGYNGLDCQDHTDEGGADDGVAPSEIDVTVSAENWVGALGSSMLVGSTSITIIEETTLLSIGGIDVTLPVEEPTTMEFVVTPPNPTTPDTYTQTITISAVY